MDSGIMLAPQNSCTHTTKYKLDPANKNHYDHIKNIRTSMQCNISQKDRVTRIGFGLLLLAAYFAQWSREAFLLIGSIMIIEGIIGWCGMATIVDRFNQRKL